MLDQGGEADYSPPGSCQLVHQATGVCLVSGVIAQLVERLHGMQEVGGSIPPGSTNPFNDLAVCANAARLPWQPTSNQT